MELPVATVPGQVSGRGAHVAAVAWALAPTRAALEGADITENDDVGAGRDR